ncbi:hypothetical protein ACLE20_08225 [Rhizobium sp. YIM 134829]|uniref:hypothetical protein n=1 Tax=Rhizobium sp. YIM 134829 TaxID=3390453 RepID=UPI00397BF695
MKKLALIIGLSVSLLVATAQLCVAIDIGDGRFMSKTNGKEELFTDMPEKLVISYASRRADGGVDLETADLTFALVKTMSVLIGGTLESADKVSGQFIQVMTDDRPFVDDMFNGSRVTGLNDPLALRSLEQAYSKGSSCVSTAIYSTAGIFQRAVMIAKRGAPSDELFGCALELSAHVYGVTTYSSYMKMTADQRLRYVAAMLTAKRNCLREANPAAQCGYNKIESMK